MIDNPFTRPEFGPAAALLAGLLGGAFVALVMQVVLTRGTLSGNVIFKRWKVWAVIAPVFTLATLSGPLPLAILVALIAAIGAREFGRLTGVDRNTARLLAVAAAATPFAALASPAAVLACGTAAVLVATALPLAGGNDGPRVRDAALMLLGLAWVAWLPAHVVLLARLSADGPGIVLTLGLAVALSDVGAFLIGRRFGRRQLASRVSPNKTIEGLAGNLAGAFAGFVSMAAVLHLGLGVALLLGAPLLIALGCVWGDLAESALKREFQQKDAGSWLPGFGGLLDRVDSLLVATPLLYYLVKVTL